MKVDLPAITNELFGSDGWEVNQSIHTLLSSEVFGKKESKEEITYMYCLMRANVNVFTTKFVSPDNLYRNYLNAYYVLVWSTSTCMSVIPVLPVQLGTRDVVQLGFSSSNLPCCLVCGPPKTV